MNGKLPYILAVCTVGCIVLLSQDVVAQDGGFPYPNFQEPSYQELNLNEDKSLIYDVNENRSYRSTTTNVVSRDSVSVKATKAKASKKSPDGKKEEDALSFNFLYYIIQKYKISDIVDQ
ncbi:MAG TPA: hypothetical protein PKN99_06425 [Cyclobacteriaceae bacterium]|jgi:hypothetical protein|nr:hypothetical protein [Cyclobacteriaceae bacterium]HNP07241.1 hypothetical protein [Cyclobacteriaceae bacterium]HRK54851.1 hypothetical protein [Cyclobacteriaceae bacterium]